MVNIISCHAVLGMKQPACVRISHMFHSSP